MTLSTVCLKLAHQPFDQDKLSFYFGHGKWHATIVAFYHCLKTVIMV
jgi:hypothetical protein